MEASLPPSLSDIADESYNDFDDAETMTAAQVLAKLEEVTVWWSVLVDIATKRRLR